MAPMVKKSVSLSIKGVLQYDKEGNFIKSFNSITEASNAVSGNPTNIGRCCSKSKGYRVLYGFI